MLEVWTWWQGDTKNFAVDALPRRREYLRVGCILEMWQNNLPGKCLSPFSRAWRVEWNISAVTGGVLPIPKRLSLQKSPSIGSTRPLAECGMQQTNGYELNGDKTSDDGKVDKEPKCWVNTRIGLVLERSFKISNGS
jgi:hypothetical protein